MFFLIKSSNVEMIVLRAVEDGVSKGVDETLNWYSPFRS